ncbi:unnamed protein product, partial [Oikopleura dioica]
CRNFGFNVSESETRTCIRHKCVFPDRSVRICICKTSYKDKHVDSTCTVCNVAAPAKANQTITNLHKLRISEIDEKTLAESIENIEDKLTDLDDQIQQINSEKTILLSEKELAEVKLISLKEAKKSETTVTPSFGKTLDKFIL